METNKAINNKYDFVILFDVENGNPNGDPDAGNAPRTDPDTGYGFVTDVCIKRKIRNYVDITRGDKAGYSILVKPDKALNTRFAEAYDALGLEKNPKSKNKDSVIRAKEYMCANYYDVRTFGMVMNTGDDYKCGIVRGPVQINFARSISPITPMEVAITRQARTTEEKKEVDETMARKNIVPYGLYRAEGYVSASLAQRITGFSDDDLAILWEAIINMFEEDHSAARGKMCMRGLYVFKHEAALGNFHSNKLFDKIKVTQKNADKPARCFDDYAVEVDSNMPEGVTLSSLI